MMGNCILNKMVLHANENKKQACITILISDKTGLKPKLVRRDKQRHFILIKMKSSPTGYNNLKQIKYKSTQFHKTKISKPAD